MCEEKNLLQKDPSLQLCDSLDNLTTLLQGMRTFTQCLLSIETLFWILYNCTIVMYEGCRTLMVTGNSSKVSVVMDILQTFCILV